MYQNYQLNSIFICICPTYEAQIELNSFFNGIVENTGRWQNVDLMVRKLKLGFLM